MTPEEIKSSQRIFEAGGAIACGCIFGLMLWIAETPPATRLNTAGYTRLLWWLLVAVGAYTGLCYLLDRLSEHKRWRFRVNWALISILGTTLLFLTGMVPSLLRRRGVHPYHWEEDVIRYALLLVAVNLFVLCVMLGAWILGFVMRFVSKEASYFKIVS